MSGSRFFDPQKNLVDMTNVNSSASTSGSSRSPSPQGFRDGRSPRPNDVFIAVMGVTGSGKSSFIKLASGDNSVEIGHGLESCTSDVRVHVYDVSLDKTIFLIDTPGFDDTKKTDSEVLRDIARWLGSSYKEKVMLHGIVYLHRISDARMQGSAKKNLIMFKKLCGKDALKRVILVTTMWDKVSENEGVAREQELLDTPEFWGYMRDNGSVCRRHLNQSKTAKQIIQALAKHHSTIAMNLQKEMVDEHRPLDKTSAGIELESELIKERETWAKRIKETEELMKEALEEHDREAQKAISEERKRYTDMFRQAERRTKSLKNTIDDLIRNQRHHDREVAALTSRLDTQVLQASPSLGAGRTTTPDAHTPRSPPMPRIPADRGPAPLPKPIKTVSQREHVFPTKSEHSLAYQWLIASPPQDPICCALDDHAFSGVNHNVYETTLDLSSAGRIDQYESIDFVAQGTHESRRHWVIFVGRHGIYATNSGRWVSSTGFNEDYPEAASAFRENGRGGLKCVALGPNRFFYAGWPQGRWKAYASNEALDAIRLAHQHSGSKVVAAAFGINRSYFFSYGKEESDLGYIMDLMGQYPALSKFLADKRTQKTPVSIAAIALSPDNSTDFILIYHLRGKSELLLERRVSKPALEAALLNWWNKRTSWSLRRALHGGRAPAS